jgi:Putative heavy-metal-binding
MDSWTHNLPPVAAERVRRQAESHVAGSLLSTPALAALAAADLEPAGEVMGCIVMHLGWSGYGCGGYAGYGSQSGFGSASYGGSNYGYGGFVTPILTSGNHGRQSWLGYGPYIKGRYHAYDTVLNRMLAEVAGLGADGAVGVTLSWSRLDSGALELIALGTAVRNRQQTRRRTSSTPPFCTELSGEDVAKALLSGWRPLGIAVGLSIAVKHHDWQMDLQTSWLQGAGNTEVDGLTGLVHAARDDARRQLGNRARQFAGAVQIVVSRSDLRVHEHSCVQEQPDHLAEASFFGTVLAHDRDSGRRAPASSLTILPLRGTSRKNNPGVTR